MNRIEWIIIYISDLLLSSITQDLTVKEIFAKLLALYSNAIMLKLKTLMNKRDETEDDLERLIIHRIRRRCKWELSAKLLFSLVKVNQHRQWLVNIK